MGARWPAATRTPASPQGHSCDDTCLSVCLSTSLPEPAFTSSTAESSVPSEASARLCPGGRGAPMEGLSPCRPQVSPCAGERPRSLLLLLLTCAGLRIAGRRWSRWKTMVRGRGIWAVPSPSAVLPSQAGDFCAHSSHGLIWAQWTSCSFSLEHRHHHHGPLCQTSLFRRLGKCRGVSSGERGMLTAGAGQGSLLSLHQTSTRPEKLANLWEA